MSYPFELSTLSDILFFIFYFIFFPSYILNEETVTANGVQSFNWYICSTGTLDAIIKMIRYEGLPGFYKGMSTKIVQSVFAASVLFMVKEELVKAYMTLAHKSQKVMLSLVK